jgi:poly(3-hydroxybutyrate) depolymerase
MWRRLTVALILAACSLPLMGADIVDISCEANPAERYALYLPSNYSPDREWNLILAFDAGARGRTAVEHLQAGAEKYGYIVAGSYNSRNGPWEISLHAADAMRADVTKRYRINSKRIYTAGQSGGARVAMQVAMAGGIAGVIASSAGFPDPGNAPNKLSFPVFGTAGTEDFNYVEMRQFDRQLTSPHRVEIFDGGHTWLPGELAVKAIEWMEVQAMKSGAAPRKDALSKGLFEIRVAEISEKKSELDTWRALNGLVEDFQGLEDVKAFSARAKALQRDDKVKRELNSETTEIARENKQNNELYEMVQSYASAPSSGINIVRDRVEQYARQAKSPDDSAERRMARRILAGLAASTRGIDDPEFQKLIATVRPPRPQ